jgi:hypothetical protein
MSTSALPSPIRQAALPESGEAADKPSRGEICLYRMATLSQMPSAEPLTCSRLGHRVTSRSRKKLENAERAENSPPALAARVACCLRIVCVRARDHHPVLEELSTRLDASSRQERR